MASDKNIEDHIDDDLEDESLSEDDLDLGDEGLSDESYDEEWDDYEDEFESFEEDNAPVKKGSFFNKAIIGGAVIIGAGILYVTMMGGSPAPESAEAPDVVQEDVVKTAGQDTDTNFPPQPIEVVSPSPSANSRNIVDDATLLDDMLSSEEIIMEGFDITEPLTPLPDMLDIETDNSLAKEDIASVNIPSAEDIMFDDALPEKAVTSEEEETQHVEDVVDTVEVNNVDLSGVYEQLDELLGRFDYIDGQMEDLKNTTVSKREISALSKSIKALEKRVDGLSSYKSNVTVEVTKQPFAPVATAKPVVARPAAAVIAIPAFSPAPSSRWIMRSAQPGRAIIVQSGSEQILTIEVGDKVAGIGRVTSVHIQNGQWIVQGTDGFIEQ